MRRKGCQGGSVLQGAWRVSCTQAGAGVEQLPVRPQRPGAYRSHQATRHLPRGGVAGPSATPSSPRPQAPGGSVSLMRPAVTTGPGFHTLHAQGPGPLPGEPVAAPVGGTSLPIGPEGCQDRTRRGAHGGIPLGLQCGLTGRRGVWLAHQGRPRCPCGERSPRQLPPGSLSVGRHGWAVNYAQRVHFQFKCVLIPEERLMASGY